MKTTLNYGKSILEMSQPSGRCLGLLAPRPLPALDDVEAAVADTLVNPIGSPPLSEIVKAGEKVTIIASDITRYSATEIFMPCLLNVLNDCGVRDEDITILFALGIHRGHTDEERVKLVGSEAAGRAHLIDHGSSDKGNLVYYGETSRGTPIHINRLAAECDRLIITGAATFHYFAGFGGGRKALIPGAAGYQTCVANHLLVLDPGGGKHSMARTAQLEGNPVHEDIVEGCRMVGPHFGFYTLLNAERKIGGIFAGDVFQAHARACEELMRYNSVEIKERADMVIAGCGGFPRDINVIQAHKPMEYAFNALKEGGVMILAAECTDGFGNAAMRSWFRHKELPEFEEALREGYEINGQTAYSILLKAKRARMIMVSSLSDEEVQDMSITPAPTLDAALSRAESLLPPDYTYYLIPDASNLLPIFL